MSDGICQGVWNGDVYLGDGKLKELRSEYETRVRLFKLREKARERRGLEEALQKHLDELQVDRDFLVAWLNTAVEDYRKKYNNNSTSEQPLKNANWEVVEHQTLLQQAQISQHHPGNCACLPQPYHMFSQVISAGQSYCERSES